MNTTKKIAVALAVMMVAAAMAAPAAMGDDIDTATYSATVQGMQNTYISTSHDVGFDIVVAGTDFTENEISPSLTLTNDGNNDATVNAKFTSHTGADYGLTGPTDVIDGTNFKLGKNGFETALAKTDTDTPLPAECNVPKAGGSVDYDAQLNVPTGQTAEAYSGDVLLTFGNA